MRTRILWALLAVPSWLPAPASAAEPEADAPQAATQPEPTKDSFGHRFQFGVRAGMVAGYNMIFRYDQSPFCVAPDASKLAKDQQKVCGHGAPLALDIAASFAPLDFVEPYLFLRLGLASETETDTLPLKVVGAGVRVYTLNDSAFKIFIEPALAYEFDGGGGALAFQLNHPVYEHDVLIHLAAGPQLDFAKCLGVFIDAGLTTGVLRSIHTELELQAGVQARFP